MRTVQDEDFEKEEEIERDAFLKSKDIIYKQLGIDDSKYDVLTFITDISSKNYYDVLIHLYDKEGYKYKSFIVEIKVRNKHHEELLLEKKKYNMLFKYEAVQKQYGFNTKVYYLNYTPRGTFLFTLYKHCQYEWVKQEQNKYTIAKAKGTTKKDVTFLDTYSKHCLRMDYRYDYDLDSTKVKEKFNKQNRVKCIFDSVQNVK